MKNKYLKGAHLSERKVREMLKLFCEDLTATQIAEATGISRITINAYLKMFRYRIALWAEEARPDKLKGASTTFLYSNGNEQGLSTITTESNLTYGLAQHEGFIFTQSLPESDKAILFDWSRGKLNGHQDIVRERKLDIFHGIMDFKTAKLLRLNIHHENLNRDVHDEIEYFWSMMKSRMIKFRGLNSSTIHLHVKETEFRYNNRNRDIYDLLIGIMQKPKSDFKPTYIS